MKTFKEIYDEWWEVRLQFEVMTGKKPTVMFMPEAYVEVITNTLLKDDLSNRSLKLQIAGELGCIKKEFCGIRFYSVKDGLDKIYASA